MSSWLSWSRTSNPNDGDPKTDSEKPVRALPASWYRSDALYELERRAIFSRKWLLVSHQARFRNVGDFVRIVEAGFDFVLLKDRQGVTRAHHNICRHRAFPLVQKESGSAKILACKYHGWSYGLDGRLAKAPHYDELSSFDKSANTLFPIHTHIDRMGFIWINFDSNSTPAEEWENEFAGVDKQQRLQQFHMSDYQFDHQWSVTGEFNWKALADNYNECYHCPTGHPVVAALYDSSQYWVETSGGHIQHWNADRPGAKKLDIFSSFLYPNASITITPTFFYIMRCIPLSASQTSMEYEVYRHNQASDEDFNYIDGFYKQVVTEDRELCTAAQKNLNMGIYTNGELHPRFEKGPLYVQKLTRELVRKHREQEIALGKEIWPATPKHPLTSENEDDIAFCDELDCELERPDLVW